MNFLEERIVKDGDCERRKRIESRQLPESSDGH